MPSRDLTKSSMSMGCTFNSIFPLSMRDMSRISLIRLMRYWLDVSNLSRHSSTRSLSSATFLAMEVMPTMALSGVRISWLIRDRKSVLAWLTASALAFITKDGMILLSSSKSFLCSSFQLYPSVFTSKLRMPANMPWFHMAAWRQLMDDSS